MSPSLINPHSCALCSKFVLDFGLADTLENHAATEDSRFLFRVDCTNPSSNSGTEWSRAILDQAARDGCALCSLLIKLADQKPIADNSGYIRARLSESGMGVVFQNNSTRVTFMMATELDNVASRQIQVRPVNLHTASDQSFDLVRKWLGECLESHPECKKSSENRNFWPSLLVEIIAGQPDFKIRLVSPSSPVKYIALSYCWGGDQVKLETNTKEGWETQIPWQKLGKTIQEAIYTTWKIGLKYIWIDALCIIQDDDTFKMREISKMSKIYSSATLTIAAASSSSVSQGFLQDRQVTDYPEDVFRLPVRCQDGRIGSATLFRPLSNNYRVSDPLNGRGWTLQERYLSTRFLEFKRMQLRWTCPTSMMSRYYRTGSSSTEYIDGWWHDAEDSVLEMADDALTGWHRMIYSYTLRDLKVPTDRILAISGVAEVLSDIVESEYWAGLWTSDFPVALMWKSTASTPSDTKSTNALSGLLLPRPTEYQGPSWSWVSVNVIASYWGSYPEVESVIEVLGCDIHLVDEIARFGAVKSPACLSLCGRTKEGILRYDQTINVYRKSKWILTIGEDKHAEYGHVYATGDALEPEFASGATGELRVCLLEVLRWCESNARGVRTDAISEGLMLRKLNTQQYSRVGTFSCYVDIKPDEGLEKCCLFRDCELRRLDII